ncbi:hypothetical protein PR202_gb03744 [Eleusine coracana subsp. coracana]|uniref:F-box domain-containing protein n=1 Tax=Eleusine coracana subsp. coracana TaxID=191504 RepID=A0AAV5E084_ELECO|nr:hypothetical protein PR202_gb03744 [Eleusine coracana subsp. coracana]
MDNKRKRRNPAADLSDDLLVDILSRLQVRPLCRFNCVSRSWRDLISHDVIPPALSGFFFQPQQLRIGPVPRRSFAAFCPSSGV